MMLLRGSFTGPLNALTLCNHTIKLVTHARLLGVTIDDNKLTQSQHIFEVKKSFTNKLNLLNCSSFLPLNTLPDFCFKILLPSVSYGLPIWERMGSLPCNQHTEELLSFQYTALREICLLQKSLRQPSGILYTFMYKVKLATLAYKIFYDCTPPSMTSSMHYFRPKKKVIVPRFKTYFMKN